MPVEKDALFWETLLDHKIPKKKLKKKVSSYSGQGKKFLFQPKLSNAAELALRYDVAKSDVEKVYNIFVSMDDDGSGTISAGEVAKMLAEFGVDVSPKVVQAVMRVSDKSGDGEIDFSEFLAAVTSKIKLNNCKADIHVMFQKFDQNGDGLVSHNQMRNRKNLYSFRLKNW